MEGGEYITWIVIINLLFIILHCNCAMSIVGVWDRRNADADTFPQKSTVISIQFLGT